MPCILDSLRNLDSELPILVSEGDMNMEIHLIYSFLLYMRVLFSCTMPNASVTKVFMLFI
jgi:hypothetical protein